MFANARMIARVAARQRESVEEGLAAELKPWPW